ncbi:MAG TPA: phosphate ABC transporter permease subunit PstC [Dehalococcoidia bacterium]|nr:phosphate ABC transporter permease subunit PstC [Dehalococcoidia bacterium]
MATIATPAGSFRARRRAIIRLREAPIFLFLFACAALSIVTTVGIVLVLFEETYKFFEEVSFIDFITGTKWTPLFTSKQFGVLPLFNATLMIALGSLVLALPLGVLAAIFLSEYAPPGVRAIVKPVLEILAGIPTVVYGYFALLFIAPEILRPFGQNTAFSAASASVAMGIMILPLVASLSEDAMRAVPQSLREGAYGLGATKFEVATKVVVPGAFSGIVAAVILAASRAIGETMIVVIAAGNQPTLSWNPFDAMQAMTAYIVQVSLGDTPRNTIEYSTIFAIGALLFVATLILNIFAQWLLARFREVYD